MKRILLVLLLALLTSALVEAKGIVGAEVIPPGETEACSTSPTMFEEVWTSSDFATPLTAIDLDSDHYQIRILIGHEAQVFAANVYNYYPEKPGFLYFADVENGSSTAEGRWLGIDGVTDKALRERLDGICDPLTTLDYLALAAL